MSDLSSLIECILLLSRFLLTVILVQTEDKTEADTKAEADEKVKGLPDLKPRSKKKSGEE